MDKRDKIKKLEIWLQNGFTDGSIIGETEYNLAYLIVNLLEDNSSERQVDAMVIQIFKDKMNNIYVKTGRNKGFMTRIADGTRHDGTTVGDFEMVKEIFV